MAKKRKKINEEENSEGNRSESETLGKKCAANNFLWMIESVERMMERMGRRCEDRKVIPFVPKFIIRLVYSVVGTRRRGVVATRRSSIEPH